VRVRNLVRTELVSIRDEESLEHARRLMERHGLGLLPVVRRGRLVGVLHPEHLEAAHPSAATTLTWGEIAGRLAGIPARRVMSGDVPGVSPRTPLAEAVRLMRERGVRALPVVKGARLVGLLVGADLLGVLVERLEADRAPP
jgi:acetoin utilization protein AcuB